MTLTDDQLARLRQNAPPATYSTHHYVGCATEEEHLSEFFYDTFHDESDFLGWDVGGQ